MDQLGGGRTNSSTMKPQINKIISSKIISPFTNPSCEETIRPRDWNDVIQCISEILTNKPLSIQSFTQLFSKHNLFIYWAPVIYAYILALMNRRLLYLCWGMPRPSYGLIKLLKYHKLKVILKHSNVILVNDYHTFNDIKKLTKNKILIAPYIVDTDFYSLRLSERESFIVAPGDNDRNEELIRQIAASGIKIYRITREKKIAQYHNSSLNVVVKFKIPYQELRFLYQQASAVILPVKTFNHAAGQTSLLESLSCGTSVIISEGRTSTIFNNNDMVMICSSNNWIDWRDYINLAVSTRRNKKLVKRVRDKIELTNSFKSVCDFLLNTINENFIYP